MKQKENRTDTVTQTETFLDYMWNFVLKNIFSADLKTVSLTELKLSWYHLHKQIAPVCWQGNSSAV